MTAALARTPDSRSPGHRRAAKCQSGRTRAACATLATLHNDKKRANIHECTHLARRLMSSLDTLPASSGITSVVQSENKTNGTQPYPWLHTIARIARNRYRNLDVYGVATANAPDRRESETLGAVRARGSALWRLVCGATVRTLSMRTHAASARSACVHPSSMLHHSTLRAREKILEASPRIAPRAASDVSLFALRARLRLAAAPGERTDP